MKSQGAAKNEANNAGQKAAPAATAPVAEEKIDFSNVKIEPLKSQVFIPTKDYFQGLFGAFADSLQDNWGRLLLNRLFLSEKREGYFGTKRFDRAVDGNGRNPGEKEIIAVGIAAGMNKEKCLDIMKEIEASVKERLGEDL